MRTDPCGLHFSYICNISNLLIGGQSLESLPFDIVLDRLFSLRRYGTNFAPDFKYIRFARSASFLSPSSLRWNLSSGVSDGLPDFEGCAGAAGRFPVEVVEPVRVGVTEVFCHNGLMLSTASPVATVPSASNLSSGNAAGIACSLHLL